MPGDTSIGLLLQIVGDLDKLEALQFNDLTAGVTVMAHLKALLSVGGPDLQQTASFGVFTAFFPQLVTNSSGNMADKDTGTGFEEPAAEFAA
jgi:hypothetical protein